MSENIKALWNTIPPEENEKSLFEKTVFEEELYHINARCHGQYTVDDRKNGDPLSKNLVGLAFSGGGIRSATFGLGVLEALKENDLLESNLPKKQIHYLSTVSGGGYIGAWLSSNCKRAVECDIKAYLAKDDLQKKELVKQFTTEFSSKNSAYALLIVAVETDASKKWTVAGFNEAHEFKQEFVDESFNDLNLELEKIQFHNVDDLTSIDMDKEEVNRYKISKLASTLLNSTQPTSWLSKETVWKKSIDHLRRNSNYLSPKLGFFSADMWTMATIWLRNTLLIQLLIILAIASLLILPRLLFVLYQDFLAEELHSVTIVAWHWLTIALYILVVVGIAANLLRLNKPDSKYLTISNWGIKLFGTIISLFIAWGVAASNDYSLGLSYTDNSLPFSARVALAFLFVLAGFLLLPTLAKLKNQIWSKEKDKIKQINYTQTDVQRFVILPMLVFSLLFAAILQQFIINDEIQGLETFGQLFLSGWDRWPVSFLVIFVSIWLLSVCSIRGDKVMHIKKTLFVSVFLAPLVTAIILQALLAGILKLLQRNWNGFDYEQWLFFVWTAPLILYVFSLVIVVLLGMVGRESSEAVREWWSRYSAWLAIYGFCWMVVAIIAIYGPMLGAILLENRQWGSGISFTWVATTLAGVFASKSDSINGTADQKPSIKLKRVIAKVSPFVFIIGLLLLISMALHFTLTINSFEKVELTANNFLNAHWYFLSNVKPELIFCILILSLGSACILSFRLDINEFSLNAFYRSRLVRCYLGATRFRKSERHPQYFTGFDDKDDLKLADLIDSKEHRLPTGPFHIINCALNLGGSRDLSLHTRHSTNFTLTPLRCGSSYKSKDHLGYRGGGEREIGYISTRQFGGVDDQPTLGQAISISGAAASPNMGYNTSPVLAFLMTLFNARLGWWFPNPDKTSISKPSPNFSLFYLLKELLGVADEKSDFLAISDGGHFENLAAYELVKRKCKVIIISDGECDPDLQFEGLGRLIRMCKVDLGAKIKIDVSSIQINQESSWSRNRCAIGQIEYSASKEPEGPETGWLIYLKASMNGYEDTDIKQYQATHPTFPHETTGDQFYGEDQFESYRKLGHDIAEKTFAHVANEADFIVMAEKLNDICSPALPNVDKFSDHANRLMELWSELSENKDLDVLDKELNDSWPDQPDNKFRSAFYICSEMIQLMENVYLDLNLEETWHHPDTKGWRALFKQWSKSSFIRTTWEQTHATYGSRFQFFWKRNF